MAGSLEAFKLFQEQEKRRQARYEAHLKEQETLKQAREQSEQQQSESNTSTGKSVEQILEEQAVAKDVTQ